MTARRGYSFRNRAATALVVAAAAWAAASGAAAEPRWGGWSAPDRVGATPAQAMASERDLRRRLEEKGYQDIRIEAIGARRATIVVCSGGRLERLEVDAELRARFLGSLGACAYVAPLEPSGPVGEILDFGAASTDLAAMGFIDVAFEETQTDEIVATACKHDYEYRVRFDDEARLLDLYRLGACPTAEPTPPPTPDYGDDLGPRDVQQVLYDQGYRRVFVDADRGGVYEISACFGVRRFEMLVDRSGVVTARRAERFCRLSANEAEYVPPRPVSNDVLQSTLPLDPATCQQVLNWLQFNRPITFESGSARLDAESRALMRRMAEGVDRCGDVRILIEGHTDSISSNEANLALSEQRAQAVADLLIRNGVPSYAVGYAGFGEDHPLASNDTPEGRALNRRIELNLEWGRF